MGSISSAEFSEDISHVGTDSADADFQPLGNFSIRSAVCDFSQHFTFAQGCETAYGAIHIAIPSCGRRRGTPLLVVRRNGFEPVLFQSTWT